MSYPSEWHGSTDPGIKAGTAKFKIDGETYLLILESFEDFQKVSDMLDASFQQGKRFSYEAIRSHVTNALERAKSGHALG